MSAIELKPKVKEFLEGDKGLYINGKNIPYESGKTFEVKNHSTEEENASVSEASDKDVDKAVKAAKDAFDNGEWTKMDADSRSQLIYKFAELLHENREELAQLEALDNGKKYQQALEDDVDGTVQHFRYYAGWA